MDYRYWISLTTANYSDSSNWSLTSGGVGGASPPGLNDIAMFDASGTGPCIFDSTPQIFSMNLSESRTFFGDCTVVNLDLISGDTSAGNLNSNFHVIGDLINESGYGSKLSDHNISIFMDGSTTQNIYNHSNGIISSLTIKKDTTFQVVCQGDSPVLIKDSFIISDGTFNSNGLDVQVFG